MYTQTMLGYHAIFSTYGFWLPNDPRGSGSTYVGSKAIYAAAGSATKTHSRRSVAAKSHDYRLRDAGKSALQRPPVLFDGHQALAVAHGFAEAVRKSGHVVWACAILPDHVHLVIAKSQLRPKRVVGHFKRQATLRLWADNRHPFQQVLQSTGDTPTCWGERARIVFLDTPAQVRGAIRYVEQNPVKAGLPRQYWSFVTPFEP